MLNFPDEFVIPNYGANGRFGTTIANMPATVAGLLDVPFEGLPPLPPEMWRPLRPEGGAKRVVVLILDALGQNLMQQEEPYLKSVLEQVAIRETITSIFPSTTVNCLSSMWSGTAPAQHGLIGLHLYFPELAAVGQMIHFTPRFKRLPDALVEAGIKPETFLPVPSIAQKFSQVGVNTYAFKGYDIVNSALSQMHGRGVAGNYGAFSFADMLSQMRQLLETQLQEKMYLCAYWPTIDTLSHHHTTQGQSTIHELRALFQQIKTVFLDELSPAARQETLFFIVADHGQKAYTGEVVEIDELPELKELLLIRGAGEPRVPYLYAKQNRVAALTDYLQSNFSAEMSVYDSQLLLESGLLGPPPFADTVALRMGDITGIMKKGAVFVSDSRDQWVVNVFKSSHGGLTRDEMYVPWLGFAL